MYPNLLPPLLVISGGLLLTVALIAVRQPVARRLAGRQLYRRRSEALLALIGSTLGTAIIAGALVVGDTLNASVKHVAYQTLGPIDERVASADTTTGDPVARQLAAIRSDPNIDGVLSAHVSDGAAVSKTGDVTRAEPRVLVWGLDFAAAGRFGTPGAPSGLSGPTPAPGDVVINAPLASSLHVRAGDVITLYLYGATQPVYVDRVVPQRGVAGAGLGSTVNRNVFMGQGTLDGFAASAGTLTHAVTFVSNRGGVEAGAALTDRVSAKIRDELRQINARALVETPKRDVLDNAKRTGDSLGALFLMIGSFSIIAGALLLVNIFVMLADERKAQLGMLRAIGMRRSRMIGALTLEGSGYALAAVIPGALLGLAVGWTVAQIAAQIFRSFSPNGEGLTITFAFTRTSLVNAIALGLVIGITTVLLTSVRLSRFNVIAAIRDLPQTPRPRRRRALVYAATLLCVILTAAAVPAVAASQPEASYILPALAALCAIPLLRDLLGSRHAITVVAGGVLVWALIAPLVRPHLFDHASMAVYVIVGTLVAFSAVALVSQNQDVVLRPVRALFNRPGEAGLAVRLAVAYPLAKRFRTGATLVMYTLVTLVLVLLVEISGVINASIDRNVASATAGYAIRLDFNPATGTQTLERVRAGSSGAAQIAQVTPLVSAAAFVSDPGHRRRDPLRAVVVGVPPGQVSAMGFDKRLPGYPTDAAVWGLIARDPRYVVLDRFLGASGGPAGDYYAPGDTFTVTNPRTGDTSRKTIAGILTNSLMFYALSGENSGNVYPVVTSDAAVRSDFGQSAQTSAAFVRVRRGVDPAALATRLQGDFLYSSLVATPMAASVRRAFSANIAFFRLMQGFLALGLAIGIIGLGVVMVRAVRERRRTIGVLRALGFRSATVERSFLIESGLVAVEGVVLGSILGVLTTWLMYQKSAVFNGVRVAFPVEWATIGVLAAVTVLASLAATMAPARRAAAIRPAVAVRIAD